MSTIMEDKIKKAFEEWKNQDHSTESKVMQTSKSKTLADQLLAYIQAHPGVTGAELREIVREKLPTTPTTYVPATLKGLFDAHFVRREERPSPNNIKRITFAYYALDEAEREVARERARLNPNQKRTYKKSKVKAKGKHEKTDEGITALVPAKRHATHALDVGPTTLSIAISLADGRNYSMTLKDAKFLYTQLNQIFGGAR